MTTISMSSVRRLLNKSLSSKQHSKSQSFTNENAAPLDPNIQVSEPDSNPKKLGSNKVFDVPKYDEPMEQTYEAPDPPVKVVVRIRPKTVNEKLGDPTIKKASEDSVDVGDRKFRFDSILDSTSNQEDVFNLVGVPLVKDALAGYNASILSYGQTGSGKTYTMWGPPSAMVEGQSPSHQQGIVPRIFQMLFSEIEREKENAVNKQMNYQCRCSFLEIYNGQIGDLLDPTQRNLQIKDDAKNGFYIESLTEEYVTDYDDVTHILIKGLSNRRIGATSTNSRSSRSHIVFTCVIESWCKETSSNNFSSSKTSRITLVDIAGVERNKQGDGERESERERKDVKSSLSHLGHLVSILAEGTQPDDVMYRDSCLTHLLQQSLGGNAKLSVICNISPDIKNYGETLSTLRFGQRIKSIQNKPVINEITEEDMDGLTDQIRQLKEELIRAKLKSSPNGPQRNVRESVNQLRISLNRSLMKLPTTIDNDTEEEDVHADENDVTELCKQLDRLHQSSEDNPTDFASEQGSCDSYFTSEHETNCLHEPEEISSAQTRHSVSMTSSHHLPAVFEEPVQSESPKFKNLQRKSVVKSSSSLLGDRNNASVDVARKSVRESEAIPSSLRSSKIFSGPTESLAASLKRGLEIIDSHQQSSSVSKSSVAFSFEHLMLKPSPAADKVNASLQTFSNLRPSRDGPTSFICASCRQKSPNEVDDSLKTWILTTDKEGAKEHVTQASDREKELEKVCNEQAARIEELNRLVEQLKNKGEKDIVLYNSQGIENKGCNDNAQNPEPEIIKETCEIEDSYNLGNESFNPREKEELLMEIQFLKRKLQAYTTSEPTPNKSIDKLRSSLLSRSMQLRKSLSSSHFNSAEELEKERERWTEMESEWISLTDELRIDIESHRRHAEMVEMELQQERQNKEELDDALHRAVLGHVRFIEQFTELQEKYNHLSESHRRIMETITDVKKAAAKAGKKGNSGARYAKAFAGELSAIRAEEKRERERLRRENKSLKIQLRETAEAVHSAGELLVRLREAEESASFAETNLSEVQEENEKLRKQIEKMKNKHKMEMVTMKQYMAESKLPECALQPIIHFDEPLAEAAPSTSVFTEPDQDEESWRSAFGATYHHHY